MRGLHAFIGEEECFKEHSLISLFFHDRFMFRRNHAPFYNLSYDDVV